MAVVRSATVEPIGPLAWKPPYATGAVLKKQKKKKKAKKKKKKKKQKKKCKKKKIKKKLLNTFSH